MENLRTLTHHEIQSLRTPTRLGDLAEYEFGGLRLAQIPIKATPLQFATWFLLLNRALDGNENPENPLVFRFNRDFLPAQQGEIFRYGDSHICIELENFYREGLSLFVYYDETSAHIVFDYEGDQDQRILLESQVRSVKDKSWRKLAKLAANYNGVSPRGKDSRPLDRNSAPAASRIGDDEILHRIRALQELQRPPEVTNPDDITYFHPRRRPYFGNNTGKNRRPPWSGSRRVFPKELPGDLLTGEYGVQVDPRYRNGHS